MSLQWSLEECSKSINHKNVLECLILDGLISSELIPPHYVPYSELSLPVDHKCALSIASKLVCRLFRMASSTDDDVLKRHVNELRSSIRHCPPESLIVKVGHTIKTHKPVGKLAARLLHRAHSHVFQGFSVLLSRWLDIHLGELAHLCKDTTAAQNALCTSRIGPLSVFVKIDIAKFFLAGTHEALSKACAAPFDGEKRSIVRDMVEMLLHFQFVAYKDALFKTSAGSGMGARHSGAIANWAFYFLVEKTFIHQQEKWGMISYLRFFDDILLVFKTPKRARSFVEFFHGAAAPHYKLEVEEVSMYQVAFLDLCVFRNVDGHLHRIGWKPFVKESACHLPLHQSSCHAPAIHRSWLRAEVSRMHLWSQHMTSFHHFKELKLQRWEYFSCAQI